MGKTALVISGGGSKGAFAVGVLDYMHTNIMKVDAFDIYCGTSTGSLIVPLAACGEIDLLRRIYTKTQQNEVLIKGGITNLLRGISIHDASPLRLLILETIRKLDFNRILDTSLFLSTVCLQTENLVYWATKPILSKGAYDLELIDSINILGGAMLASSSQPVFMQPVRMRGADYVDGGVREITPLQAAVDAGAETIFSITLSPDSLPPDPRPLTTAFQILGRTLDIFSEDVGQNDYRLARLYESGNQYLADVRNALLAQNVPAGLINQAFALAGNPFAGTAVRTIHEIRPAAKLEEGGEGGLTFNPVAMESMYNKGLAQAKLFFDSLPVNQPVA